jgi:hypothetical protein
MRRKIKQLATYAQVVRKNAHDKPKQKKDVAQHEASQLYPGDRVEQFIHIFDSVMTAPHRASEVILH